MSILETRLSGVLDRVLITGLSLAEVIFAKLVGSLYIIALAGAYFLIFFVFITDLSYNGSIILGAMLCSLLTFLGLLQGLVAGVYLNGTKPAFMLIIAFTITQAMIGNVIWLIIFIVLHF
jgi:hypothetical protein